MLTEHERTAVVEWDCKVANNTLTSVLANGINFSMCNLSSGMGNSGYGFPASVQKLHLNPSPKGSQVSLYSHPFQVWGLLVGGHGGEAALLFCTLIYAHPIFDKCMRLNFLFCE